jgi:GTPase SAR1 family protein
VNAIIVGSKSVGKTTIGKRLAGKFHNNILLAETYGIDFHFLHIEQDNSPIYVQIWDINFQNYECNNPEFFIDNADLLFLVFEDYKSFKKLLKYKEIIRDSSASLKYLLFNKIDLHAKLVNQAEIKMFIEELNLCYYQISALKGINFKQFKDDVIGKIKKMDEVE